MLLVAAIFLALFLDNVVTTIVIPILPLIIKDEVEIGILFSIKALVQILLNPLVGILLPKFGSTFILLTGNVTFILGNILFCMSNDFWILFASRTIQGISSALMVTSGLSLIAETFQNNKERGHAMGNVMFGLALGVMVGPPLGGLTWKIGGGDKWLAFIIISALLILESLMLIISTAAFQRMFVAVKDGDADEWEREPLHLTSSASSIRSYHMTANPRRMLRRKLSNHSIESFRSLDEILIRDNTLVSGSNSPMANVTDLSYLQLLRNPHISLLLGTLFVTNLTLSFTEPTLPILWDDIDLTKDPMVIGFLFLIQTLAYSISSPIAGRFPKLRIKFVLVGQITMVISLPLLMLSIFCKESPILQWIFTVMGLIGSGFAVGLVDGSSLPLLAHIFDTLRVRNGIQKATSENFSIYCESPVSQEVFNYDRDGYQAIDSPDGTARESLGSPLESETSSSSEPNYGKLFALTEIAINSGFFLGPIIGTLGYKFLTFVISDILFLAINIIVLSFFIIQMRKK